MSKKMNKYKGIGLKKKIENILEQSSAIHRIIECIKTDTPESRRISMDLLKLRVQLEPKDIVDHNQQVIYISNIDRDKDPRAVKDTIVSLDRDKHSIEEKEGSIEE